MIDVDGNLIEGNDGGICKLKKPLDNTKSKWYSLCGDLCAFETHNVAFDHINNIVLIGTQDNGNMLGNGIRGYSIQPSGDGGNVQILIDDSDNIFYERCWFIIKQKPIALSLACNDSNLGKKVQSIISSPNIRIYLNSKKM